MNTPARHDTELCRCGSEAPERGGGEPGPGGGKTGHGRERGDERPVSSDRGLFVEASPRPEEAL